MHRRAALALAAAAISGCVGSSDASNATATESRTHSDDTEIAVTDWVDATNEAGIAYSAIYVEAEGSPPPQNAFRGTFDDGSHEMGTSPADAERYGDVGADLYLDPGEHDLAEDPPESRSGWVVFHPDEDDAELVAAQSTPLGSDTPLSWERP